MKRPLFTLLLSLCCGVGLFAQKPEMMMVYTEAHPEVVEKAMTEYEYEFEPMEDNTYKLNMSGLSVFLFMGDTDLQLYCGIQHEVSYHRINKFNKEYKWGRAYIDQDGDPVLESDVSFIGGLGYDGVLSFLSTYESLLDAFVEHIK